MEGEYPEEYTKCLMYSLKNFKKCNIGFLNNNVSQFIKYWRFVYIIPITIVHLITLSLVIVNVFLEGKDPFENADTIPVWLCTTQSFFKACIIMINRKHLNALIDNVGMEWRVDGLTKKQTQKKILFLKHLYSGQKLYTNMAMFMTWQYLMIPFFETLFRRYILHQQDVFMLPFTCVYPFGITEWWIYIAVYIFEVYSMLLVAFLYLGADLLLIALCTCLSIKFILLQEDLLNTKPFSIDNRRPRGFANKITDYGEHKRSLEEFIKRHQKVILLTQQLNDVFNKMIFINLLFSKIIICFFALAAKASSGAAYMVNNYGAIMIIMMTILLLCSCSEMLSVSSGGIAGAAANNLWYKGDRHYRKNIRLIIMRSQKPCTLTSLDSTAVSLNTFTKVLSTTWSYFSLVNTFYEERD